MKISIFDQEKEIFAIVFKDDEIYKTISFTIALMEFMKGYKINPRKDNHMSDQPETTAAPAEESKSE